MENSYQILSRLINNYKTYVGNLKSRIETNPYSPEIPACKKRLSDFEEFLFCLEEIEKAYKSDLDAINQKLDKIFNQVS